jgi:DNA-binding IclR family transcriptional regulator
MREEFSQIKNDGYAVDNQEFHEDVYCLAAPVRDSRGDVTAAIGVTGPATHFTPPAPVDIAALVKEAGRDLSAVLGYTG